MTCSHTLLVNRRSLDPTCIHALFENLALPERALTHIIQSGPSFTFITSGLAQCKPATPRARQDFVPTCPPQFQALCNCPQLSLLYIEHPDSGFGWYCDVLQHAAIPELLPFLAIFNQPPR